MLVVQPEGDVLKRAIQGLLIGSLVVGGLAVTQAPAFAGCMSIYRIYYNSPGSDTGTNYSINGEWIQLHNGCSTSRSLHYWKIKDVAGHTYTFGTYTLGAYKYVKIHTGKGTNTTTDRYWGSGWYIWNNTGDTAYVRNGSGTLIDSCSYPGGGSYVYC
jgi:Lamin Tail Domain